MSDSVPENIPAAASRGKIIMAVTGVVLIIISILMATYSLVAYSAWKQGEETRLEQEKQAYDNELANQLALAREDMDSGKLDLALRRLDWILGLDPNYQGASELRAGVLAALEKSAIPESTATPLPTPTAVIVPEDGVDPDSLFTQIDTLIRDEQWLQAVEQIASFQLQFPNFNRRETDRMLYDASINLGLELVSGDQIELGIYYINQAEKLGDLPEEAEAFRTWAELYLLGIGHFGVDWGQAVFYFRGLCSAAPYYQDSCTRLYESLVAHGDIYTAILEWCPAEELYFEAILYDTSEELSLKLDEARSNCLEATPTPTATVTPEIPTITPTPGAQATPTVPDDTE